MAGIESDWPGSSSAVGGHLLVRLIDEVDGVLGQQLETHVEERDLVGGIGVGDVGDGDGHRVGISQVCAVVRV